MKEVEDLSRQDLLLRWDRRSSRSYILILAETREMFKGLRSSFYKN